MFVEFLGWFEDLESVYPAMEYLSLGDLEGNVLAVAEVSKRRKSGRLRCRFWKG